MKDYVAIIEIGSNAVRFVVYDGPGRAPVKIHNERNLCGLGAGLGATGRLNPAAVEQALDSLRRFHGLIRHLEIRHVHIIATAAVRDAADGPAFMAQAQAITELVPATITGAEEARLSARGVLMNGLGANGVIGDFGGGSLELIRVADGALQEQVSLPIGSHHLHALATRAQRVRFIDAALDGVPFLRARHGDFTALGGAWRSIAKAHMHHARAPLHVLDHYAMTGAKGAEFAALLSRQSLASLEKTVGFTKKRVRDVSVAALALERVLERIRPPRLAFSATGLREGVLFDRLPADVQEQDGLIAACESFARRAARFNDGAALSALARWMMPLFGDDAARRVTASCLLSDAAGFAHEDEQAEQAFRQILVLPLYAASHADRAFLALSQYARYKGYLRRGARARDSDELTRPAQRLLDAESVTLALRAGLAQRAAYMLTGGALALLENTALCLTPETVRLTLRPGATALNTEGVQKALAALAAEMGRTADIGNG